jgi:hypothetical protein
MNKYLLDGPISICLGLETKVSSIWIGCFSMRSTEVIRFLPIDLAVNGLVRDKQYDEMYFPYLILYLF